MALPHLATVADVEASLGRPLTTEESGRIDMLLASASAEVRGYTGQALTRATSTVTLPVLAGRVRLPQHPVIAVDTVDGQAGAFDVVGPVLRGISGCEATVTYTHGYEQVPADILAVVVAMVLRNLPAPQVGPAKSSESLADYSYRMTASSLAGRPVVDMTDRPTLDRYRPPDIGALWLARP